MRLRNFLWAAALLPYSAGFTQTQSVHSLDVVIHEIMADPSPSAGLPELEWIELRNRSANPINLQGWRLAKAGSISGPMPDFILQPDSLVIACSRSSQPVMAAYGPTVSVTSFPSLSNAGDLIALLSPDGQTIHAVAYKDSWYRNELKKEGGWSLEMIDVSHPCQGKENWTASSASVGGTPGVANTSAANNPDEKAPRLLRAYPSDSLHIILVFDEPLDSLTSSAPSLFRLSEGIGTPDSARPLPFMFDKVSLKLPVPLQRGILYTVSVQGAADCSGNSISPPMAVPVALPEKPDSQDIVINEILFNPKPNGNDYVEIYNRSKKAVNIKDLFIANRNASGVISSVYAISDEDRLLYPGDYLVVTASRDLVLNNYIASNPDAFADISSMPSFGDDKGDVLLLGRAGNILDELQYEDDWHLPLLTDAEGVSLERISFDAPARNRDNWMSAASHVGYGTPTYQNSQHLQAMEMKGDMSVHPKLFSPDGDGTDDFALINYRLPGPGYLASITIYDAAGRVARTLQRNALCGTEGFFRWDGTDDKGQRSPVGLYIILAELFNLEGKKKRFKMPVVLAVKR